MSSYVIRKSEYVKAAGLVAGIAQVNRLCVFDYEYQRNSTTEDYYRRFVECYEMNAKSVQEQYRDDTAESDSEAYLDLFNRASEKAMYWAIHNGDALKTAIMTLRSFFNSSLYQVENEEMAKKMQDFYYRILVEMMPLLYKPQEETWGTIEI